MTSKWIEGKAAAAPFVLALIAALAFLSLAGPSYAQGAAAQEASIPVGTVITMKNWQNYKQFMSVAMQKMFEKTSGITMPAEAEMVIGPSNPVPEPKQYMADTEHYAGTVTLRQLPSGGFVPQNYVAGYPFPNAADPDKGIKMLYDMFYNYKPWLLYRGGANAYLIDKYGNISGSYSYQVLTRMEHVSDVGMPHELPNRLQGVFATQYNEITAPEEAKYFVILTIFPSDPSQLEQIFNYIPALRRSLRASAASRCAPVLGTDLFNDDLNGGFNGIPSEFNVKFIEEKSILNILHQAVGFPPKEDFYATNMWWPKPVVGKFELEKVDILEASPIASVLPGYCYPLKRLYLDANQMQLVAVDYYDKGMKYWKSEIEFQYPVPIPGTQDVTYNSFLDLTIITVDHENNHVTATNFGDVHLTTEVPAKYRNLSRYASPSGLDQIMQ
jgi:Protein of unknown function (DUF1329)